LPDAFHQVLGIGYHEYPHSVSLAGQKTQSSDTPSQGHLIVRGAGGMKIKISTLNPLAGSDFDQPTPSTTILPFASVAQAALIQMDKGDAAHSMT
jgi:hypothetical protein